MADMTAARRMMVEGQIRTSDVTDSRVIAAFLAIPRELFASAEMAPLAYLDLDLPLASEKPGVEPRSLLKPMVLAKLVQNAGVAASDRVLVVGCGSGYSAAILGRLAESVVALEEDAALVHKTRSTLSQLGAENIEAVHGPLTEGWAAAGPYDLIFIDGAIEILPETLKLQAKEGGRIITILGRKPAGKAMLYRLVDGELSGRSVFDANGPLLPGFAQAPEFAF